MHPYLTCQCGALLTHNFTQFLVSRFRRHPLLQRAAVNVISQAGVGQSEELAIVHVMADALVMAVAAAGSQLAVHSICALLLLATVPQEATKRLFVATECAQAASPITAAWLLQHALAEAVQRVQLFAAKAVSHTGASAAAGRDGVDDACKPRPKPLQLLSYMHGLYDSALMPSLAERGGLSRMRSVAGGVGGSLTVFHRVSSGSSPRHCPSGHHSRMFSSESPFLSVGSDSDTSDFDSPLSLSVSGRCSAAMPSPGRLPSVGRLWQPSTTASWQLAAFTDFSPLTPPAESGGLLSLQGVDAPVCMHVLPSLCAWSTGGTSASGTPYFVNVRTLLAHSSLATVQSSQLVAICVDHPDGRVRLFTSTPSSSTPPTQIPSPSRTGTDLLSTGSRRESIALPGSGVVSFATQISVHRGLFSWSKFTVRGHLLFQQQTSTSS